MRARILRICVDCETDDSDPDDVAVGGLGIHVALDQRLPLLDHALQLVGGQAHAVERAQAVLALDIVADESELPEAPLSGLLLLQVSQGHLEDTSLQSIGDDLGSLSPVDQGLADVPVLEVGWGLDVIPVLAGEGVNNLLLGTHFKALIFTDSHLASL